MNLIVLLVLLLSVCFYDVKYRKIPNRITFSAMILGFFLAFWNSGLQGLFESTIGFLVGLMVLIVPFALGGMGAGDVKLMAAIGSLMGVQFVIFATLGTGIMGGVLAIVTIGIHNGFAKTILYVFSIFVLPLMKVLYYLTKSNFFLRNQDVFYSAKETQRNVYVPYGVAIATGSFFILILQFYNLL